MKFSTVLFLYLTFSLGAAPSLYKRAQELSEDDPREAEALYAYFIKHGEGDKLKRAAAHELFALRLKQGRLKEAFFQSKSAAFQRRFLSALEEGLKISDGSARRLVKILSRECAAGEEGDADAVGATLDKYAYPPSAYDFAVAVLQRCSVADAAAVFPEFGEGADKPTRRDINLALMEIRELLAEDKLDEAKTLLNRLKQAAAKYDENEAGFTLGLAFAEVRLAAKEEDFEAVKLGCAALEKKKPPRWLRHACRTIVAYALMREEAFADAYARLVNLKIPPVEIDNRLLRLTAAVAAGEAPPEKLAKFRKRKSYPECAAMLRALADSVFSAADKNR